MSPGSNFLRALKLNNNVFNILLNENSDKFDCSSVHRYFEIILIKKI